MRRRTRHTLLLALACALLAALVALQLTRERAAMADPLTRIDTANVQRVVVECAGCTTRTYRREGAHWRQLEPATATDANEAVARLLAIAHAPVRQRYAGGELDERKLGLDPPLATLTLDRHVLRFGDTDAIHGDRYVATADGIVLVPDRFSAWLFAISAGTEPATDAR